MMKNRKKISKAALAAFVIISFCFVSIATEISHAQGAALASGTFSISSIWNYFFSEGGKGAGSGSSNLNDDPTPTPPVGPTDSPTPLNDDPPVCGGGQPTGSEC